jgi:hypothetical protein
MTAPVQSAANTRNMRLVRMVSGKVTQVQTDQEAEYFEESRDAYLKQTKFTENTDLKDLDRLLVLELMTFRWTQHLAAGVDYDGDMVNERQLTADIKLYSDQINKIKESMGLSKKAREDAAADGNFSAWLSDLKARARLFGIHRENQLTKALVLMKELFTIVNTYDRCDAEERRKTGFENEGEILDWIRNVMQPEFNALDEYFREHSQRYWIREQ